MFIISTIIIIILNSEERSLFANLPATLAAGFALGLCLLITYRHRPNNLHNKTHTFLTIGIGLWFIAEIIYTYYQLGLMIETPFPSLADPLYLAGYVFFGFYFYSILKLLSKTIQRDVIILVSIAAMVSVVYILNLSFGIEQFLVAQEDMLRTTLGITYFVFRWHIIYTRNSSSLDRKKRRSRSYPLDSNIVVYNIQCYRRYWFWA